MNERIQKLAEQAGAVQYGVDYQRDAYPINLEELKKFAELIVRECLVMTKGYEFALGRKDELSKTMREHFGVEE